MKIWEYTHIKNYYSIVKKELEGKEDRKWFEQILMLVIADGFRCSASCESWFYSSSWATSITKTDLDLESRSSKRNWLCSLSPGFGELEWFDFELEELGSGTDRFRSVCQKSGNGIKEDIEGWESRSKAA